MSKNPLHELMEPESIAIVGAGNNPLKMGTMHILSIIKDGYQGKIFPIHPRDETVAGLKAYKTVSDIPETPDLAFIVVPSSHLLSLMEDFGKKGTRHAVVITAGFKETGKEGKKQEDKLNEIAHKYGMRFVGPNCMGIINSNIQLNTTVMPLKSSPGMLGLASQSGTYITQVMSYLYERGIRLSKAVSVGNEANINIIDVLEYLGNDDDTKAIALYIEGIRDVERFLDVARGISPRKPILAQYIGGSEAGARSGMSHTGALAGPDHMYDGLFKQAGIIRVDSIEDLYGHGWALAALPPMKGKRIGIVTNSGGPGSGIAHTCEEEGLEVPPFSAKLQEKLAPLIPPHAPSGNPVDLTFSMDPTLISEKIPQAVMESGEVDGIILHGAMTTGFIIDKYPHLKELLNNIPLETMLDSSKFENIDFALLPKKLGIPMTVSSWFNNRDNYTEAYQLNDVPTYDAPEKAARAMAALYKYKVIQERKPYIRPDLPEQSPRARDIIDTALKNKQKALDEYEAKKLLAEYGITVCSEHLATSREEAVATAKKTGFPVAVKVCHPEIMHKTESGMVFLNQKTEEQVLSAYDTIQKKAGKHVPVLISEMVRGDREFLAGIVRHKSFGTCVVFGLGGVFTEAFNDTAFRLTPLGLSEAEEMIDSLRTQKILREFRGMPAIDREKTADLLQKLSFIPVLHPEIKEIDMNPLIYRGSEPVVVDSLVILEKQ